MELVAPGKRSMKEGIFIHHKFPYGPMVSHSLADIDKCPTCIDTKAKIAAAVKDRDAIIRKWIKAQISAEEYDALMTESLAVVGDPNTSKEVPPVNDNVQNAQLPNSAQIARVRDWAKQNIDDLDAGISVTEVNATYERGVFDTINWLLGGTEEAPDE